MTGRSVPGVAEPESPGMRPIRVALIDDSATFLRIAIRFLEEHEDVVVVGSFGRADDALPRIGTLQPDVVITDLAMPGLSGLEAIPRLRTECPGAGIIALTMQEACGYRGAALAAGADEFVSKSVLATDLLPAIRRIARPAARREEAKR